jgi:F-type H+-transporting ATPase subunit gamma
MPTLREVRNRITGVKKTQKITRAMKMVAAAKLRRAQSSVISARPYAATMGKLLTHLASQAGQDGDPLLTDRPVNSVVLVVITADRGMCGAFNSNILRATQARLNGPYAELYKAGRVKLVTVGRKGSDFFRKNGFPILKAYPGVFSRLGFATAQTIARLLVGMFRSGEVDRVEVIFNEFKNVAQQRVVNEQFLPVPSEAMTAGSKKHGVDYLYEPDGPAILSALIPRYLDFRIWRALLESSASEEGARMTAMENATENASEMIDTLQLQYNKARQASITKELLEVVAGAEALSQA